MATGMRPHLSKISKICASLNRFSSTAPKVARTDVAGIAVFSAISFLGVGLGIWQLKRYNMKIEKVKNNTKNAEAPTTDLSQSSSPTEIACSLKNLLGQKVFLGRGHFVHTSELLLGPRSAPGVTGPMAQGMATNPQGYFVMTPFVRASDGVVMWVKRGWVPIQIKSWNRPSEELALTVYAGQCEKRTTFSPLNSPSTGKLLWLDETALKWCMAQLQDELNLSAPSSSEVITEPVMVVEVFDDGASASRSESECAYPVPPTSSSYGSHEAISPMTHLVYATTWFSLAAAGFGMTYLKFRRRGIRTGRYNASTGTANAGSLNSPNPKLIQSSNPSPTSTVGSNKSKSSKDP